MSYLDETAHALIGASVSLNPRTIQAVLDDIQSAIELVTRAGSQYAERWRPILGQAWDAFQPWVLVLTQVQQETLAEHNRLMTSGGYL